MLEQISLPPIQALILSTIIAYLLGALPIAVLISNRRGVDIFNVGTRLAGASNVRRQVGNVPGAVVLVGDMLKAVIAVLAAGEMRIDGLWLLSPSAAVIVGHWKPVFSDFRGGDGVAPLGGLILAIFTEHNIGLIAIAVGAVVTLGGQRLPYTSLLGVVAGCVALIWLNINAGGSQLDLAFGVSVLAVVVLGHAWLGHRRRASQSEWQDVDDPDGTAEQPADTS